MSRIRYALFLTRAVVDRRCGVVAILYESATDEPAPATQWPDRAKRRGDDETHHLIRCQRRHHADGYHAQTRQTAYAEHRGSPRLFCGAGCGGPRRLDRRKRFGTTGAQRGGHAFMQWRYLIDRNSGAPLPKLPHSCAAIRAGRGRFHFRRAPKGDATGMPRAQCWFWRQSRSAVSAAAGRSPDCHRQNQQGQRADPQSVRQFL